MSECFQNTWFVVLVTSALFLLLFFPIGFKKVLWVHLFFLLLLFLLVRQISAPAAIGLMALLSAFSFFFAVLVHRVRSQDTAHVGRRGLAFSALIAVGSMVSIAALFPDRMCKDYLTGPDFLATQVPSLLEISFFYVVTMVLGALGLLAGIVLMAEGKHD